MNEDKMREEFEAWAVGDCFARDRMPCGIYVDSSTEIAWRAWQAARVAPAVQRKPLGYVVPRKAELLRKGALWGISILDQPEDGHTLPVYTAL